jgi:hypothetical protein
MRLLVAVLVLASALSSGIGGLAVLGALGASALLARGPGGSVVLEASSKSTPSPGNTRGAPSATPSARWVRLARAAASTCPGLSWSVLVAIGKVETDWGHGSEVSSAGAEGPMQFLPSTWAEYGAAFGPGAIWRLEPSLLAAAALLCANGGADPRRLPQAIFAYNHSATYVEEVLSLARQLSEELPNDPSPSLPGLRREFTFPSAQGDVSVARPS